MVENLKESMKQNRNIVKDYIFKETNGFEEKIYWDKSLESWIIVDNELGRSILSSPDFTANRKKKDIEKMDATDTQKQILKTFYTNWLMYMDGEKHIALRKKMQKPVNKVKKEVTSISEEVSSDILKKLKGRVNAVDEIAKPFSYKFLSKVFGISIEDYINILNISTSAVNFLWIADPSEYEISKTVDSIVNTNQYINDIIAEKRYNDVGLFKLMLDNISEETEFIIALINMVIDGHEPFQSSLTNLIFHYIHFKGKGVKEISDKDLINESIRYEPPFSYCARECVEQTNLDGKTINVGDRVMLILYISNNNERSIDEPDNLVCPHSKKENLSFGYGTHRCLGANITILSLVSFLKSFKQNDECNNWQIEDYSYHTTYGFIEFKNLYLESINE